jgi:hypothetical protein
MTRTMTKHPFPYALMSSTLGTVLVSVTSVWLATSAYQPATASDTAHALHSLSKAWSHPLFRVPLIPPRAGWIS